MSVRNEKNMASHLTLNALELDIYLGWPESERLKKQTVLVDIKIQFFEPPVACVSDNLEDTFCYNELINKIKDFVSSHKFRLIEHFNYALFQFIKNLIKEKAAVSIRIHKKTEIPNLKGGAIFCYEEKEGIW